MSVHANEGEVGPGPYTFDAIVDYAVFNDAFTLPALSASIDTQCYGAGKYVKELFVGLQPYVTGWLQQIGIDTAWQQDEGRYSLGLSNAQRRAYVGRPPYECAQALVDWRTEIGAIAVKRLMWHSASDGVDIEELLNWMGDDKNHEGERLRMLEDLERLGFMTAEPNDQTVTTKIVDAYSQKNRPYKSTLRLAQFALGVTS